MDIKQETILDHITADGCFSVKKQPYTESGGHRTNVGLSERRAFCPGDWDGLREYAPELEPETEKIWTAGVIEAWQEKQKEWEDQLPEPEPDDTPDYMDFLKGLMEGYTNE